MTETQSEEMIKVRLRVQRAVVEALDLNAVGDITRLQIFPDPSIHHVYAVKAWVKDREVFMGTEDGESFEWLYDVKADDLWEVEFRTWPPTRR